MQIHWHYLKNQLLLYRFKLVYDELRKAIRSENILGLKIHA